VLLAASPLLTDAAPTADAAGQGILTPPKGHGHDHGHHGPKPAKGTKGGVASEAALCSDIGADIIKKGGNAADAMVATTLCVGTVGMYHSGIGGGSFILVRDEDGNYEAINAREMAPAAAHKDMYKDDPTASTLGGLAVGVPGELKGLEYLHDKYGSLPWKTVVMPSVKLARHGFVVNEDLVRYMESATSGNNFLVEDPIWAEVFAPKGKLLQLGDKIYRKRYAKTLETIARKGADGLYKGKIAKSLAKFIQSKGGIMTAQDLANYKVEVNEPLTIDYRGYKLFSVPAPSSGAVMLNMLKTMEQYPSSELLSAANLTNHRFVEAMKFAYGARQEFGDPRFVPGLDAFQQEMLSAANAAKIRARILDHATQPVEAYDPKGVYAAESHGTAHIVAADRSGMTVSSTTTVNLLFGAKIMSPDTGVILNNEMDDFSQPGRRNSFGYEPSPNNFIAPGKRPLSSMSPLIVEFAGNGTVYFATGAAGGSRIISSTAQVAFSVLEGGTGATAETVGKRDMLYAVSRSRLHHQLMPDQLVVETGFDEAQYAAFGEKGHNTTWTPTGPGQGGQSAVQAVMRLWNGTFEAVGEIRQVNSGGTVV